MQGIQHADGQRRGEAVARGHDAVEFSLNPGVHLNDADLASGDILIHLGQDAFGSTGLDETFTFFSECNAPQFIKG